MLFATAVLAILLVYYLTRGCIRPNAFPPGPVKFPVFGGLVHLRGDMLNPMKLFQRSYGKVFSFNMGSAPVVVVADYQLIQEIGHKEEFAHRPGGWTLKLQRFQSS